MKSDSRAGKLLQSGIIFTVISFVTNIIFYLFQAVISRNFDNASGEFGLMNNTITLVMFLGLPLAIATQAVTHYIARFHFTGDDARLHGLLVGCRKFLLHMTIAGSVIAIILVKPLGAFFHIPRAALTLIALICVLGNLWSSYVTALCQGLGWFKRLALIGLLAATFRVLFGWPTTRIWPIAEWAVLASVAMLLPNLILLFWRNQFPRRTDTSTSPWSPEFVQFLVVSTAWAIGSNFFTQGDNLVAQRHFSEAERDAYSAAEKLAVALVTALTPLLTVLFTHRSGRHHDHGDELGDQLKLIALYAVGLVFGAVCLYLLREYGLNLLHRNTPEAGAMIGRLAVTMVFIGLLQALGTWSLASRWIKISLLYGALGIGYWAYILVMGKTSGALLQAMPVAAGSAFVILFIFWIIAMRRHRPVA
jgi:O-antigen/teichoic acid export membrane protein